MAFSFDDVEHVPQAGEIVYCLWQGQNARPVLVYDKEKRRYSDTGAEFWAIWIFYGTGVFPADLDVSRYLVISGGEVRKCGLDKRTRFDVSRKGIDWYPWTSEFFVPKPYVMNDGNPYVGTISDADIVRMNLLYRDALLLGR